MVSKLREEKDEAVAKVAQVNAEKDEAIAKLTAEKKETVVKLANEREAERKQFENVIAELNKDETLQNKRQLLENSYTTTTHPLDCDDPGIKFNNNVLTETTNSCRFSVSIHEEPEAFLDALMKDKTETEISKTLYQKVIQDERVRDSRVVVYWSFMVGKNKACDLLLRLLLEKKDENEIVIRAVSVDEEELETTILPNPHPHATKKFRLLLNAGAILLRPLPFGQTSFTFTARVQIGEGRKDLIVKAPSAGIMALKTGLNVTAVTGNKGISQKLGFSFEGAKADQLFFKIAAEFYERFQKEGVVDERYKRVSWRGKFAKDFLISNNNSLQDFIENIDNAPALTVDEQRLIGETMKLFEEASSKAKRVAGTANEPVEKFLYHSENGGAAWAMTVTKVDLSAESLFAELWLLDTYARKAESKGIKIRQVWNNLDGTRGLQFTTSVGLPGGFQDRLFETWMTWEELIDEEGRRTFIIAIAPLETYEGTHHEVVGAENMVDGTSEGVFIVKELTENTCEYARAQMGDLKLSSRMPVSALEVVAMMQMGQANVLQEKLRRNGKEVDREGVVALAEIIGDRREVPLMEDQAPAFERCLAMLGDGGYGDEEWKLSVLGWKVLESPSPDVRMLIKYNPPKNGERSVGTGMGLGVVDCSAEEVAAWVMDYCSNERMRISEEEGNPARLELRKKARVNERTFATVKKMPFFLDNRELVFRQIWKSEEGKVLVAVESVADKVDYGVKPKTTRGLTRGLWLFRDLLVRGGAKQCRVTFVTQLDAGGSIPTWVVDKKIPLALTAVQEAIEEFRQDEKVDAAELREKATFMRERGQDEVYSEEENALLERVRQKFEFKEVKGWKQLKSPDVFVKMESIHEDGSAAAIGRAVTVVDATIEDCAAWEVTRMTRENMKLHYDFGGIDRKVVKLSDHSELFHNAIDFGVRSFAPREWLAKSTWKMVDENTIIVGVEDIEDDDFPIGCKKGYVRASSIAFWKYKRLPEENGFPQTSVTYCQQIDLKGFIPSFAMNSRIVQTLEYLSTMRKKFDKSLEIDEGRRAEIVEKIKQEEEAGEVEALAQVEALFEDKQGWERPPRIFGSADSKVQVAAVGGKAWCKTSVKIRTEIEEVAAFLWSFGSRANMEISGDVERTFEEDEEGAGGFRKIVKRCQRVAHHRDRSFMSEMSLQRADNDTITLKLSPISEKAKNGRATERARGSVSNSDSIEAKETVVIRLRRLGAGRTKLEFACEIDLKFGASRGVQKIFVERRLGEIIEISIYFQRLVPLEDFTAEDGQALGNDLLWKAEHSKKRVERLKEVVEKSRTLQELNLKYPWMKAMLATALEGNIHMNRAMGTKLICVSEKEAMQIGKNLLAEAGVNEWRVQNPAVKELMEEQAWFEPMAVVVSKGIVKTASWGMMARVIVGAVLSMTDLATDLLVLRQFWFDEDLVSYKNAQLVSLSVSLGIQLALALFQTHKKGMLRVVKECLIVVVGMKAPWDAYRVAMGAEQEKGSILDAWSELIWSKCIEIFSESIPGIIIQSSAILSTMDSGREVLSRSIFSLVISLLTTGFVSATLSYDFDTVRCFVCKFYLCAQF
ncbi:hypothetical protein TL16_g01370 [Triparma laevis f. inornata]|uniref:Uncharacterized protein n=1 Tax=Triparma laevis f. inornata TaxID=1714386 RepID=A0A9W6ZI24_9STRA|nr:hypothetical protein TL16_g01370 [Triparma laevis f. inornata]